MEFGMFHEFQALPGESAAQSFASSLAQVDAAECWGLDAMWLAELHFAPDRSVLASPLILAASIAQRTTRIRIGTAVQVLPLCHPLRLAEEVATVDHLSQGRLIFGVGRSGFAQPVHIFPGTNAAAGDQIDVGELVANRAEQWFRAGTGSRTHPGQVEHDQRADAHPDCAARKPKNVARVFEFPVLPVTKQMTAFEVDGERDRSQGRVKQNVGQRPLRWAGFEADHGEEVRGGMQLLCAGAAEPRV